MLVLGYVQSHTTGESFQSFHFPAGLAWTIFVEASPELSIQTLDYNQKVEERVCQCESIILLCACHSVDCFS